MAKKGAYTRKNKMVKTPKSPAVPKDAVVSPKTIPAKGKC